MADVHSRITFDWVGFQKNLDEIAALPIGVCEPLFILMVQGAKLFEFRHSHCDGSGIHEVKVWLEPTDFLSSALKEFGKNPCDGINGLAWSRADVGTPPF